MLKGSANLSKVKFVILIACVILSRFLNTAFAAEAPDAGKTLEGLHRSEINPPTRQELQFSTQQSISHEVAADSTTKFVVRGVAMTGQDIFAEQELLALIADKIDKEVCLADLEEVAALITDYFHKHGYIVARAYIPAQRIDNGIVQIAISPGYYDDVIFIKNIPISDDILKSRLGSVTAGAVIEKSSLEKALWLINDLDGVEARATLMLGERNGTSKLIIELNNRGKKVSGHISTNNFGNRFTGSHELSSAVSIRNLNLQGDSLSVYGVTAGGGLTSGSLVYQLPVAFEATGKLDFSYSRVSYSLGEEFASLNARGIADSAMIAYRHTFRRSRMANVYGQIAYSYTRLSDAVASFTTDKHSKAVHLTLSGDSIDQWGGGGANTWSIGFNAGRLYATDDGAIQAGTPGAFGKWNVSAARNQYISDRLSFISFTNVQWATKNLDSSEKLSLGGAYGVRAYPKGEASGDQGFLWNSELHWTLPSKPNTGVLKLISFYDCGAVRLNKEPWIGANPNNHRILSGAGLGIVWNKPDNFSARITYAWKVGSEKATSDNDRNGRFWWQITQYF